MRYLCKDWCPRVTRAMLGITKEATHESLPMLSSFTHAPLSSPIPVKAFLPKPSNQPPSRIAPVLFDAASDTREPCAGASLRRINFLCELSKSSYCGCFRERRGGRG